MHIYANMITVDLAKGSDSGGLGDVVRDLHKYWMPGMEPPAFEDPAEEEPSGDASATDAAAELRMQVASSSRRPPSASRPTCSSAAGSPASAGRRSRADPADPADPAIIWQGWRRERLFDRLAGMDLARVDVTSSITLAHDRHLPVDEAFATLLPDPGLIRGRIVGCTGAAATSLALALASRATMTGSWLAVVGMAPIGIEAAREMGVAIDRLVSVDADGCRPSEWADRVAAAADGFELILTMPPVGPPARAERVIRKVRQRVQARGVVLLAVCPGAESFGWCRRGARCHGGGVGRARPRPRAPAPPPGRRASQWTTGATPGRARVVAARHHRPSRVDRAGDRGDGDADRDDAVRRAAVERRLE